MTTEIGDPYQLGRDLVKIFDLDGSLVTKIEMVLEAGKVPQLKITQAISREQAEGLETFFYKARKVVNIVE